MNCVTFGRDCPLLTAPIDATPSRPSFNDATRVGLVTCSFPEFRSMSGGTSWNRSFEAHVPSSKPRDEDRKGRGPTQDPDRGLFGNAGLSDQGNTPFAGRTRCGTQSGVRRSGLNPPAAASSGGKGAPIVTSVLPGHGGADRAACRRPLPAWIVSPRTTSGSVAADQTTSSPTERLRTGRSSPQRRNGPLMLYWRVAAPEV